MGEALRQSVGLLLILSLFSLPRPAAAVPSAAHQQQPPSAAQQQREPSAREAPPYADQVTMLEGLSETFGGRLDREGGAVVTGPPPVVAWKQHAHQHAPQRRLVGTRWSRQDAGASRSRGTAAEERREAGERESSARSSPRSLPP